MTSEPVPAADAVLPGDWREWASSDPSEHPNFCRCLDGEWCALQLDAYQYFASMVQHSDGEV